MGRPRLLDLPHGFVTQIDEADWSLVQSLALYRGTNGYTCFSTWENGAHRSQTLHRFLMNAPKGSHVDHINGDKLDNRRENLRVVTPSRNQVNRKSLNKNNRSGVRGVDRSFGKWRAQITVNRKNHYLGMYPTKEEAASVRREAELRFYGELCP